MEKRIINLKEKDLNIISENATLRQALESLDMVRVKVLLVVSQDRLVASLTDGDIRRAILSGHSVESPIINIANYTPFYLVEDNIDLIEKYLDEKQIVAIPIVDDDKKIQKIYALDYVNSEERINEIDVPVVIMAGGLGTRLYPYTKILPKPLIPIGDIPISERIIQSFQNVGCKEFHMIVNYKRNMIKAYFNDNDFNYNIKFWDEEIPLGTGGGIFLLKNTIKDTFILTNCDVIILDDISKIIEHHKQNNNKVTMVCSLKNFEIPYGIVNFSDGGEIASFQEKPQMSFFTNTGYYILDSEIFNYINENEKIGMPEIIDRMRNDNKKVGIYPISENSWLDMGQFDTMESMERTLRKYNLL